MTDGEDGLSQNLWVWRSFPAEDENPAKTWALLICVFLAVLAATHAFDFLHGLVALVLLFVSLCRYFLPTNFKVDEDGVEVSFLGMNRRRVWGEYARFVLQRDGIFLSPFEKPSRLDSFRGDFLKFSPKLDKDALIVKVREKIKR